MKKIISKSLFFLIIFCTSQLCVAETFFGRVKRVLWQELSTHKKEVAVVIGVGTIVTTLYTQYRNNQNLIADYLKAAETGDVNKLRKCLSQGVDPKVTDSQQQTALIKAAENKKERAVVVLLEQPAVRVSINHADQCRRTALWYALNQKSVSQALVQALKANGAVYYADFTGLSPRSVAH